MRDDFIKVIQCKSKIDNNTNPQKKEITNNSKYTQFIKSLSAISESNYYKKDSPELSYQHKIGHVQKVMLFSQIIAQNEELNENQIKILLASAAFHDCGRTKGRDNGEHGESSAKIAKKYFEENITYNPYNVTQDEIGIIQVAIEYHVALEDIPGQIDSKKIIELCNKYGVNKERIKDVEMISAILKDADALDRTRFILGSSMNSKFLRTETAKKQSMIELAKKINQKYAREVLNENYSNAKANNEEDNIKALHEARHNYKEKNNGIHKKERDVSAINVILIFMKALEYEENKKLKGEKKSLINNKVDELEL